MDSGWGRFLKFSGKEIGLKEQKTNPIAISTIAQGNCRSYGDSALSKNIVSSLDCNKYISFDENTGLLSCQSGLLLSQIIEDFAVKGFFPSVTPGTSYVTVGGCVASDVHGKNHHSYGCFSESVSSIKLIIPSVNSFGDFLEPVEIECSRVKNSDIFYATCGGMGLTGIITEVSFYLKKINSNNILQRNIKTCNLRETFDVFESVKDEYSVAWIDCITTGKNMGRSVVMFGDFSNDKEFNFSNRINKTIPFDFPEFSLNKYSVSAFNSFYYNSQREGFFESDINNFFYPLDSLNNWNRIYGKKGFIQYQFIVPKEVSYIAIEKIMKLITNSGMGSFLAVLKLYGKQNKNFLSFPLEGYSLALDFRVQKGLFELIKEMDDIVIEYGGRIYLAKDSLMKRNMFEKTYNRINEFQELRNDYKMDVFNSLQSKRIGLF